jgi:hypothetical protein
MGPRPPDFDESLVRQSPTFIKWLQMIDGAKLRYACREFIKGHGDDEERLMRRIMIARRNNLKDHQVLKRARQLSHPNGADDGPIEKVPKLDQQVVKAMASMENLQQETGRKRRPSTLFSDAYVAKEMDILAVEATRSYRTWLKMLDGASFVYNQKYTKGKEGHDWLLKKNIWRRMRYRRENKKIVDQMRQNQPLSTADQSPSTTGLASQIVDQALLSTHAVDAGDASPNSVAAVTEATDSSEKGGDFEVSAAVEAAMGVAESYAESPYNVVHNPLDSVTTNAALDAAARLAAAAASNGVEDDDAIAAAEAVAQQQNTKTI